MMSWGWVKQEDEEDNHPVRSRADYVIANKSGSGHTNKKEEWGKKTLNKKKSFKRYNNFLSMFDINRPVWNSTAAFLRL